MKIGMIGAGHMGASMGTAWAAKGQTVVFSFAQDQHKLRTGAAAPGPNARTGTPAEAVAFGDIIVRAVPWGAVTAARQAAGPMHGRVLFSCGNCLKPDCSGLVVGTTTAAAEESAKLTPGAKVVEALPRWRTASPPTLAVSAGSNSARSPAAMTPRPSRPWRGCWPTLISTRWTPGR